jgi:hypothetical protein
VKPPPHIRNGEHDPATAAPDWPTLIGRLADGLTRVVRAEIMLLERRVSESVAGAAASAVAGLAGILVLVLSGILGIVCLLAGYILLLHRWLPAWQACGIGGLTMIVIGLLTFALLNASARRRRALSD